MTPNTSQSSPENQTAFFEEDRFWENTPSKIPPAPLSSTAKKSSTGKKLILIFGIFFVLLLLLATVGGSIRRQMIPAQIQEASTASVSATPTKAPETNTERAILNFKTELDAADPFGNELSFPPVSFNLSLPDQNE